MERELVLAARMGDEAAFARLIEAEAPRIYRAVLAVVKLPEDAQEVVQDASIRAWRRANNIFVEAHTDGSVGLAGAEALVASFHWAPGVKSDFCLPVDASSPSPQ